MATAASVLQDGRNSGIASPLLTLEHINLNVPSWTAALERFWVDGLGFAKDDRTEAVLSRIAGAGGSMKDLVWVNTGLQQVHMPVGEPENPEQSIPGTIGLVYRDLEQLKGRLKEHGVEYSEDDAGALAGEFGPALILRSPTGVRLMAHARARPVDPEELVRSGAALPGGRSLGSGMLYVELECARGVAAAICRFYREVIQVPAKLQDGAEVCVVPIGLQLLRFRETTAPLPPYDGHHIAIYVGSIEGRDSSASFTAMYRRCEAAGIVYSNPRFPNLRYDTLQDALRHNEFRILDMIDPESGSVAYTLEHEIRSLEHPGFSGRALVEGWSRPSKM